MDVPGGRRNVGARWFKRRGTGRVGRHPGWLGAGARTAGRDLVLQLLPNHSWFVPGRRLGGRWFWWTVRGLDVLAGCFDDGADQWASTQRLRCLGDAGATAMQGVAIGRTQRRPWVGSEEDTGSAAAGEGLALRLTQWW
jgi:hypothetical protein